MGPVPSLVINVKKKGGLDKSSPYNKLNPYNKLTPYKQGGFDESNPYQQFYILQKVGLINQAPT